MPREGPFNFSFSSPADALSTLLAHTRPVEAEAVHLDLTPGRVLAQTITADRASPPVDVSSMDGYAVRVSDLGPTELPIVGEVRIGREPAPLPAAGGPACVRIVTGGAIPAGADAVIKREDVTESPDRIVLQPALRVHPGQNIRRAGENVAPGTRVAAPGSILTPAIASALASFGVARPMVYRAVTVWIITTGDELVGPDAQPTPYQLRDSNAAALRALFQPLAFATIRHTHVRDDEKMMAEVVGTALAEADALLLTGGVSMGHRDFVAEALSAGGVRTLFHGLPQRPGKPVLGGVTGDGRPVLGLPGNPMSVMVTARRLALPAVLGRAGVRNANDAPGAPALVRVANPDSRIIDLWWHRPARVTEPGYVELIDAKSSGDVVGAAQANGFVEIPPHQSGAGPWPFYSWGV